MKKLFAVTIGVFLSGVLCAQYDPEALTVLDAMSAKYKQVEAFQASFTQQLTNKDAGLDDSITGTIQVKGDMYVLELLSGQKVFNDGKNIYTYSEEYQEVTINTNDTEESEITIGNVYDIYKEGFKYALIATLANGDRVVELDPESRDKTYFKIRMTINAKDELKSFTVFERTNNVYTYTIDSFEEASIPDEYFTFDPAKYPNVEVLDFR